MGPMLAAWITDRTPALHGVPFSLNFACVAALAALSGFGPAIVAILVSVLAFRFEVHLPENQFSFNAVHLERAAVLIAAAFFLGFLAWKQRRAEARFRVTLASLEQRSESLIHAQQASESATWVFNSRTMQTAWDEGATEIFGRPFKDLDGRALPMDYVFPEDREHMRTTVEAAIASGSPIQFEFRTTWPNGEIHWLEARGTRAPEAPHLWRGVTFDITRRKVVETALVRTEKLAAMGRLASTVAHEVNNPLESVTNLLYLARSDDSLSETTRSYLTLAEEELGRLANITRLTLSFVRTTSARGPVDINEVLENVLEIFHRKCEQLKVGIDRSFVPGLEVDLPAHELRQILINLISNAIDALSPDNPRIRLQTLASAGRVILTVEDTGHGIEGADQGRVFDAFFTTKSDVGTGIGLWVTRELVEKHGGHISVESGSLPDGYRTRFRVDFHAAPGNLEP